MDEKWKLHKRTEALVKRLEAEAEGAKSAAVAVVEASKEASKQMVSQHKALTTELHGK